VYAGHHPDVIDVIGTLASSQMDRSVQRVNVHDFTKADIRLYNNDNLENCRESQELQREEKSCHQLVEQIIEEAQSVFLWVFLVTESLLDGLNGSDRIIDLQGRLRAFPSNLQEFFMHIYNSLEPIYRVQTAKIFQCALAASQPLSIFIYWFLEPEEENEEFC